MEKNLLNRDSIIGKLEKNRDILIVAAFCVVALAIILIGFAGLKEPIVPVCLLVIMEAAIAVLMHNAELWMHGVLILVELIAGILIGRIGMMILCVIVYAAATAALRFLISGKE